MLPQGVVSSPLELFTAGKWELNNNMIKIATLYLLVSKSPSVPGGGHYKIAKLSLRKHQTTVLWIWNSANLAHTGFHQTGRIYRLA